MNAFRRAKCDFTKPLIFSSQQRERFFSKIEKLATECGCWIWCAGNPQKYGSFGVNRVNVGPHRVSYALHKGVIPEGVCVCHKCDTPLCVNPEHLFLGTNGDNTRDSKTKGRRSCGDRHYSRISPDRVARGEHQGLSKLSTGEVRMIRFEYDSGVKQPELAKRYGCSQTTISKIILRRTWTHV
jgi:hypothetical protein